MLVNKEENAAHQSFIRNGEIINQFKFFRPFKTCYLQLKLPNNNITHVFQKT